MLQKKDLKTQNKTNKREIFKKDIKNQQKIKIAKYKNRDLKNLSFGRGLEVINANKQAKKLII